MKVTQYRYKKEQLMVQIRNLEAVVETLRSDSLAEQIAAVRNRLCFTLPGYLNGLEKCRLLFGAPLIEKKRGRFG